MNDTQLAFMLGWIVGDSPGSVRVIEEVNLRSPGGMRAETFFLRHLGKASRMLGWRRSLLKLLELSFLTDSMKYQGCQRRKLLLMWR